MADDPSEPDIAEREQPDVAQSDEPDSAEGDAPAESALPPTESAPPAARSIPRVSRRTVGLSLVFAGLVAVIVVNVVIISKARQERATPEASLLAPSAAPAPAPPEPATPKTAALAIKRSSVDGDLFKGDEPEPEPTPAPSKSRSKTAGRGTVLDAASRGCSTRSVDGLSRQIIAQARCIDAQAFTAVPRRSNLKAASNVYLYLEAPARDRLLKALDANKKHTMTVNSALRTVAQQYLLRRWSLKKVCGIQLATPPGESNHETGLALDIREHGTWRKALETQGFRWLGSIDRVHFDYKGPGAVSKAHLDIRAFQQLWNLNHPDDRIPVNGRYTPELEDRLEQTPARGFPRGPSCRR